VLLLLFYAAGNAPPQTRNGLQRGHNFGGIRVKSLIYEWTNRGFFVCRGAAATTRANRLSAKETGISAKVAEGDAGGVIPSAHCAPENWGKEGKPKSRR
jgi:hypothetical protein